MSEMDSGSGVPTLTCLFRQLGLPEDEQSIDFFIKTHRPLVKKESELWEASFWSAGQSEFLRSAFEEDSEWARAFDELNARLRPKC